MPKPERSFALSSTTIFIMITSAIFASLFLLANAQPWKQNRFIEPITDCSQLPLYNIDTKIAGPWTIKVDSCYNGAGPQGLCSIEGFESSSDITRQRDDRPNTIEHGFVSSYPRDGYGPCMNAYKHHNRRPRSLTETQITIVSDKNNIKTELRCNGILNIIEARVLSGPGAGALDWHAVGIDHHPSTGRLVWGKPDAQPVQAYRHYRHGIPVEGIFLGSNNQTNWAVHSAGRDVSIVDMKPYWVMRLMIPETSIRENEFRTLIRIDGSWLCCFFVSCYYTPVDAYWWCYGYLVYSLTSKSSSTLPISIPQIHECRWAGIYKGLEAMRRNISDIVDIET